MKITIWHRQGLHGPPPADGANLAAVYTYERDLGTRLPTDEDMQDLAEQAFRMFNDHPADAWEQNHTTRYYDAGNRSLSVDDVVVVGEVAMACDALGWLFVSLPVQDNG